MANTAQDEILWPITPGRKSGDLASLLDPTWVPAALAWAASVKRPLSEQRAIEAAARARK